MNSFIESVAERQRPPVSGSEISLTVSEFVDQYMIAYAGRDMTRATRLRWWVSKVGILPVVQLNEDHVFFALQDLSEAPARHYVGKDADEQPIFKAAKRLRSCRRCRLCLPGQSASAWCPRRGPIPAA